MKADDLVVYEPRKPDVYDRPYIGKVALLIRRAEAIADSYFIQFSDGRKILVHIADIVPHKNRACINASTATVALWDEV